MPVIKEITIMPKQSKCSVLLSQNKMKKIAPAALIVERVANLIESKPNEDSL